MYVVKGICWIEINLFAGLSLVDNIQIKMIGTPMGSYHKSNKIIRYRNYYFDSETGEGEKYLWIIEIKNLLKKIQ